MAIPTEALTQGTVEWLELRKKYITGSDANAIMGVSPWTTPYQLFEEKLGYRHVEVNDAMRRGLKLEPFARAKLQTLLGIELNPKVVFHPKVPWIMASLDCIDAGKRYLIEIKVAGKKDHEIAKNGAVPEHYMPQLQHQIFVSEMSACYYYSFDGSDGVLVPVQRNDVYIKDMLKKEKEFYDCLQTLDPPALCDEDYEEHRDSAWYHLVQQFQNDDIMAEKWTEKREQSRQALIDASQGRNSKGAGIRVTKIIRRGTIDYKRVDLLQDIDLELYRKEPVVSWRIANE